MCFVPEQSQNSSFNTTSTTIPQVECRRVLILEFFGEHFPRGRCKATCDNCIAMQDCDKETKDCTEQAREGRGF